jgi:hypothetical protein
MTDTASSPQWSPLSAQNIDLGHPSDSGDASTSSPPGRLLQGDASKRKTSVPAGHGDSAPSTAMDSADSTLHGLGHAAKYFVALAI